MPSFRSCCVLLSFALGANHAAATVTLTTGPGYPPFTDRAAPEGGIMVQVVRAVFERMGEPVSLAWLPWKRGYALTLAGKYSATFPYVRSPEREQDFLFSDPLLSAQSFLYMHRGDTLDFDHPDSFRGRVLCVPQGYASPLETGLRAMIEKGEVTLEQPTDILTCFRMLLAQRVDSLSAFDLLAREMLRQVDAGEQIQRSVKPVASADLMLIAPKNNPASADLIQRFNLGLKQVKGDDNYRRLLPQ